LETPPEGFSFLGASQIWFEWKKESNGLKPVSVKKMGEGGTGEASDILKAQSSGEDPRATGGLASSLPHAWDNKTKQHTPTIDGVFVIRVYKYVL